MESKNDYLSELSTNVLIYLLKKQKNLLNVTTYALLCNLYGLVALI